MTPAHVRSASLSHGVPTVLIWLWRPKFFLDLLVCPRSILGPDLSPTCLSCISFCPSLLERLLQQSVKWTLEKKYDQRHRRERRVLAGREEQQGPFVPTETDYPREELFSLAPRDAPRRGGPATGTHQKAPAFRRTRASRTKKSLLISFQRLLISKAVSLSEWRHLVLDGGDAEGRLFFTTRKRFTC